MSHIFQVHRQVIPGREMDFLVLGRQEALRTAPDVPHVAISIATPGAPDTPLAECAMRLAVLRIRFHDFEESQSELAEIAGQPVTLFSEEHARAIVQFVNRHRQSVRLIVCQCDAGMSRSAAVAAALSRWLQDDDEPFFRHYLPNRLVYETVLAATAEGNSGE